MRHIRCLFGNAMIVLLLALMIKGGCFVEPASALILFQDDNFHKILSHTLIIDEDNNETDNDIYLVANQGVSDDGIIRYNSLSNLWEISNDGGTYAPIASLDSYDLDLVYDNDDDKIWDIDNILGLNIDLSTSGSLNFDLQNTGDIHFQDNGTTFASFHDDGLFELSGIQDKEFVRVTDTDNSESVGIYSGAGSPDGIITAEAGSIFLDSSGTGFMNTSNDNGNTWSAFDLQKKNTITVAKQGGQFTTIEAALASISGNSATNTYVIQVYPGIYQENPLTMKSFVDVVGLAGVQSVKIEAINPAANLITMASEVEFANFVLDGVTTGACISATGILSSFVSRIELEDCQYGVRVTLAQLSVTETRHRTGTMTNFIYAQNGAFVRVLGSFVSSGTLTSTFTATGSGTTMILTSAGSFSPDVTNAIFVDNGAIVRGAGMLLDGATNAIRIGSTGSETTVQLANVVAGSDVYDLLVETTTANIAIASGVIDRNKLVIPSGNDISIFINDQTDENKGTVNLGEFTTGSPENPSQGNFGEGDSYTSGMIVYTFNPSGDVYTDITTEAESNDGSPFSFPSTAVNNAIYLSSERTDELGNFVRFQGYQYSTNSPGLSLGTGTIVHEYWNGSVWTPVNIICTHETLYYRYDSSCYLRPNSREQIRFDNNIIDDWTANDPPSTGTNRYWIRIRVSGAITTAPVFEQFKVHSSHTEIGPDGTINFFADARQRRTFITSPSQILFGLGNSAPNNASFTVGSGATTWTDQRTNASFPGIGVFIRELTGSIALPKGIDTSNGLITRVYWKKSNSGAGDVQWKIDYLVRGAKNVPISNGSNITPSGRSSGDSISSTSGTTIETTPIGDGLNEEEIILSEFTSETNINGFYEGDMLLLRFYRDPADVDDTYISNAILLGFEVSGVFWTLGEKL